MIRVRQYLLQTRTLSHATCFHLRRNLLRNQSAISVHLELIGIGINHYQTIFFLIRMTVCLLRTTSHHQLHFNFSPRVWLDFPALRKSIIPTRMFIFIIQEVLLLHILYNQPLSASIPLNYLQIRITRMLLPAKKLISKCLSLIHQSSLIRG